MKKTLAIVLVALLAVTGVFANTISETTGDFSGKSVSGGDSKFTVTLTVPGSAFLGHTYGFSSDENGIDDPDLSVHPTNLDTVNLDFNDNDKTATTAAPVYVYWKVRTAHDALLSVSSTGLINNDKPSKVITLDITADSEAVSCSGGTGTSELVFSKKITGNSANDFGAQSLTFKSQAVSDGTFVGGYTATLTLKIETNA